MTASPSVNDRQRRMSSASTTAVATLLPLGLVMFFFFVVPLVGMAVTSVQAPSGGVTLEHYESLASGRRWLALRNSLFISSVSSLVAAILGTIIAWAISHIDSKILHAVTGVMSSVLANSGGAALAFPSSSCSVMLVTLFLSSPAWILVLPCIAPKVWC